MEIDILEEFKAFIIPLNNEEFRLLEQNILKIGCKDPLIVWQKGGKHILIDGHHRFQICKHHKISYEVKILNFSSKDEVKEWMIDNQLGRRNLAPFQSSYYRGLKYLNLKNRRGGYEKVLNKGSNRNTAQSLAKKFNVSESTIKRDAILTQAVENISVHSNSLKNKILKGDIKLTKNELLKLSKQKPLLKKIEGEVDLRNYIDDLKIAEKRKTEREHNQKVEVFKKEIEAKEPLFLNKDHKVKVLKGRVLSELNNFTNSADSKHVKNINNLLEEMSKLFDAK